MRNMRSRKERRMDSQTHYGGLEKKVSSKAREEFKRPAFSARQLIRAQVKAESPEEWMIRLGYNVSKEI